MRSLLLSHGWEIQLQNHTPEVCFLGPLLVLNVNVCSLENGAWIKGCTLMLSWVLQSQGSKSEGENRSETEERKGAPLPPQEFTQAALSVQTWQIDAYQEPSAVIPIAGQWGLRITINVLISHISSSGSVCSCAAENMEFRSQLLNHFSTSPFSSISSICHHLPL